MKFKFTKKQFFTTLILLILVVSTLTVSLNSAFAFSSSSSLEDDRRELQALKDKYDKTVANKNNAESIIDNLSSELSSVERDRAKAEIEMAYLNNQIEMLDALIEKNNSMISDIEKNIEELQKKHQMYMDYYADIVKYSYMEKDVSPFEILFEAKSISDFLTRLDFVSDILNYGTSIIESIDLTQKEIEANKADLERSVTYLSSLKETQYELINEQQDLLNSLDELKDKLKNDQEAYKSKMKDSEREEDEIAEAIKKLQQAIKDKEEYKNNGWARPLPPSCITVSSPWGERTVFGEYSFHKGIDFPCPVGTNVYAVDKGTVITATYTYGYGWHVIIDHGGGVSTLYGHADRLLVSVGDTVTKGQLIMKSGESGHVTGPHLHFGVLVYGEYINPETKGYLDTSSFTNRYR